MTEDIHWLRDEYASKAFAFFLQRYFDKEFEQFADDCELSIHETIATLSYMLADEMIKQR